MGEECAKHGQQLKALEARQFRVEKDVDGLKEDRTENRIIVKQISDTLPRLEKVINVFQLTMVKVNENLDSLNKSNEKLEEKVDEIEQKMQQESDDKKINILKLIKNAVPYLIGGGIVYFFLHADKLIG